jgi:hypothetical protein
MSSTLLLTGKPRNCKLSIFRIWHQKYIISPLEINSYSTTTQIGADFFSISTSTSYVLVNSMWANFNQSCQILLFKNKNCFYGEFFHSYKVVVPSLETLSWNACSMTHLETLSLMYLKWTQHINSCRTRYKSEMGTTTLFVKKCWRINTTIFLSFSYKKDVHIDFFLHVHAIKFLIFITKLFNGMTLTTKNLVK